MVLCESPTFVVCRSVKSLQSCPTLCDPMDCSLPGSSVHGILQARILQGFATFSSRGPSRPRDQTHISHASSIGRQVLYHWDHLGSPLCCLALCKTPDSQRPHSSHRVSCHLLNAKRRAALWSTSQCSASNRDRRTRAPVRSTLAPDPTHHPPTCRGLVRISSESPLTCHSLPQTPPAASPPPLEFS